MGGDSIDAIGWLMSNLTGVRSITCVRRISHLDSLPDVPEGPEQLTVERGLRLRAEVGISFWDAVLLRSIDLANPPQNLLGAAGRHSPSVVPVDIGLDADLTSTLRSLADDQQGQAIDLRSRVQMADGGVRHLPMLDFRRPSVESAVNLIVAVVSNLDVGAGFVLWSGSSFHFLGARLISTAALQTFLGRALLYAPLVDSRWIGHQLIEGVCSLRISKSQGHPHAPRVVATIAG
jgi:hypothetical protein